MKLGVVGIGQAGGKIVDALLEYNQRTNSHIVRNTVTVNTATADLNALERVPEEVRVLMGQSSPKHVLVKVTETTEDGGSRGVLYRIQHELRPDGTDDNHWKYLDPVVGEELE